MALKQTTLLLVEDDEGHATLIQMNLQDVGLENPIARVTNGQDAIDFVDGATASGRMPSILVMLDLNLPVVDGYGVLKHLKSSPLTRSIPVIVLTSTDDRHEIERCYALGCNAYLRKPVEYADFVNTIRRLGLFLSVIELPGNVS